MRKSLLFAAAFGLAFALPATAAAADGAANCLVQDLGVAEMSVETPFDVVEGVGMPEALPMAGCADEWYEYRWVWSGSCCYDGYNLTWRDRQQFRQCCLQNPPQNGVTCGSWENTSTYKCRTTPCPSGACAAVSVIRKTRLENRP